MNYIDIHCHLDFPDYGEEIAEVIQRMKDNEIGAISIGCDLESSKRAVKIAEEAGEKYGWDNIWACIGIHPNEGASLVVGEAETNSPDEVFNTKEFEKLVQSPKVIGIGECGLDYFRIDESSHSAKTTRDKQTKLFRQQIEFAIKHDKPLMLHCRPARNALVFEAGGNAYDEVLEILEEYKKEWGDKLRGNSHFFAGNVEQAKRFVDLGFSCSFTGVVTFTKDYDEVIRSLPQTMIMSETDAPFVAPVPHRGKRNEPSFVLEVVKKIAEIRGESEIDLKQAIMHNAERMFGIKLVE